ncbi:LytR cell envelope-related transcriptional attenuator [Arthrobacter sp. SLBN-83]|uniref:LytR C-terminal domain-containing protein n=1 Tax=Arthrobacter sp. SLBN-83 TaxID=2768449 RepID=UPI001152A406|nr:LytR C-terminal domain-containing protein [Arthrobacter sp. SLBN-83]TQJ58275.1 LytR cell envelope-related transcriptional attenuator [Arthrobacter sp. SLBN-83]
MTRYARDEFDKVPEAASRQGVHRTASAPSRVRLWPILAVGVAALAIGLVSFLILPKLGFNSTASQASATVESAPLAGTGSTPSPTQSSSAPASVPAPSASAAPTQSSEPEPSASANQQAVVDKTQPVAVYNAAGTAGLASRVGGTVQADGWRPGQVGNWSGAPQKSSVIFYAGPQQLASAQELAGLLNIPTVVSSTEFQVPLVVVLGPGYR